MEIPIAILAVGAGFESATEPSFEGNAFLLGCLLFALFNLLFAPTLCWSFCLCLDHRESSPIRYSLLSLIPWLLLSVLYLDKYFDLWATILLCGTYFVFNAIILAATKRRLRLWLVFLVTFAAQMFLFSLSLSIP